MAATWVVKGNLKGPKGDKGETGKSVRSSDIDIQSNATVPLANIKPNTNVAVGDTIFDVNGDVFTVTAVTETGATVGTALSGVSMKGPKGDKGVQGERGDVGAAAGFGTPTATVDGNVGTPKVTVTATGDNTSKVFDFAFKNLKGATGDKGERGETGPAGADGAPGTRGSKWSIGTGTPTDTDAIAGDQYLDTATGDVYTFA